MSNGDSGLKKGVGGRSSLKESSGKKSSLRGKFWIGDNEYGILRYCLENGLTSFTLKEVAQFLEVDVRRAHDALKRLMKRGWVEKPLVRVKVVKDGKEEWVLKPARGLYRLTVDPTEILSKYRVHRRSESMTGKIKKYLRNLKQKATQKLKQIKTSFSQGKGQDSRVASVGVWWGGFGVVRPVVSGWRFDNVRGFVGCGYVGGDRGRVLGWRDLSLFDSLSYLEVQRLVDGVGVVDGLLAIYTNWGQDGRGIRVEWRPPKGFVKRNGVEGSVRGFWEAVLNALKALMSLLPYAPLHVLRRFLHWLSSSGVGKVVLDALRV